MTSRLTLPMAKSVKRLYKSGFSIREIANTLGKSAYSVSKTIKNKGYNIQFKNEHKAFNSYKNGKKLNTVSKELGKSKTTFYRLLKESGNKKRLMESHNDDFVKKTQKFIKSIKEKNFKNYVVGKADYDNDLIQSWKKSGKKIPKYFFKGVNAKSDLRDFDLKVKSISNIHYFDSKGDKVSKNKFVNLYSFDISKIDFNEEAEE